MSLLKYIDRLKRMDDLIRRKATGNAKEFAEKLNISTSQLFEDLKEMKELGAPLEYCSVRRSYLYKGGVRLTIDFLADGKNIRGGKQSFEIRTRSSITRVPLFILASQVIDL